MCLKSLVLHAVELLWVSWPSIKLVWAKTRGKCHFTGVTRKTISCSKDRALPMQSAWALEIVYFLWYYRSPCEASS